VIVPAAHAQVTSSAVAGEAKGRAPQSKRRAHHRAPSATQAETRAQGRACAPAAGGANRARVKRGPKSAGNARNEPNRRTRTARTTQGKTRTRQRQARSPRPGPEGEGEGA